MTQIQYPDDVTGAIAVTHGSDGRLNVSSRSDERIFYSSRDDGDAYIWHSLDAGAAAGEFIIYIQNTSPTKKLIIKAATISPGVDMSFIFSTMTGVAAGTPISGFNLNLDSGNVAPDNSFGDAAVTTATAVTTFHTEQVLALTTANIDFHDALILGQNDAIGIEGDVNAGGTLAVSIIGHFE